MQNPIFWNKIQIVMKTNISTITLGLTLIIILGSCSSGLRYFTQDMLSKYRWNREELKSIQFYLSDDIVLWRELSDHDTRIKNGQIRVEDESEVEEVIIKKGTPGVIVLIPKQNKFAVSFDKENSNYLMFGPNPKAKDRYVLLAKDWDRRVGKVTYGKRLYNTSSESAFASLMVDIKKAKKVNYSSEKATGRKVRK